MSSSVYSQLHTNQMPKSKPSPTLPYFEKTPAPMARFFKMDPGIMHKRTFAPPDEDAYYHLVSNTVGGSSILGDTEKEAFEMILSHVCKFLNIEVLTSTIISDRFELLIRVPNREKFCNRFEGAKGEELLLSHLEILYSEAYCTKLRGDIEVHRSAGKKSNEKDIEKLLNGYKKRFCSVAALMGEMKVRFSRWYNRTHARRGTLWATRYGCTLLETKEEIKNAAVLIEYVAVSEGLTDHPANYPWCGYARALDGSKSTRRGLCRILGWPLDGWETRRKQAGKKGATGAKAYLDLLESAF